MYWNHALLSDGVLVGFWDDVGNAVSSAASAVGDVVQTVVTTVVDTAQDAVDTVIDGVQEAVQAGQEWVCRNTNEVACTAGNVVGGAVDGALQGAQDIVDDYVQILRDQGALVGSVLRQDPSGVLLKAAELGMDLVKIAADAVRFSLGGPLAGGVVNASERSSLRAFVRQLINDTYGGDPQRRDAILREVGLAGGTFGFRLPAEHRVLRLTSEKTDLWQWHESTVIDLYQMAGLLSFNSVQLRRTSTVVHAHVAGMWVPANRWTIAAHLESKGARFPLRVYAMSKAAVAERMRVASDKCRQLGVRLSWNDGERFSAFRQYAVQDISTLEEFTFNMGNENSWKGKVDEYAGTLRDPGWNCTLLALAVFNINRTIQGRERRFHGWVIGRDLKEGEAAVRRCDTKGRDDQCCATVEQEVASCILHRGLLPNLVFRYVLAHEIGHYLGLCHLLHHGIQNLMYTAAEDAELSIVSPGLIRFFLESEPAFTPNDARNVWRFILDQLNPCLPGPTGIPEGPG